MPYDVVSTDEARTLAADEPLSFLHVSRAEIDLPPGTNPYSDEVYAKAVSNMDQLRRNAPLVVEEAPSVYVYRLEVQGHRQTGVAACFSIDEYAGNLIRRHEKTRKDKEDDRTRHIVELRAQTGPVFLTHVASPPVQAVVDRVTPGAALFDFTATDGVRHTVWRVGQADGAALQRAFGAIQALYIADGHHRAASAARAREALGASDSFLAVAFPHDQVRVLPYNRVVKDLGPHSGPGFVQLLRERFQAREGGATPGARGQVSVFVDERWYTIQLPDDARLPHDQRLDVSRLHDLVLAPWLGIGDVTRDTRIDFIGGARGVSGLESAVRSGRAAVAFSMFPVSLEDVMRISDAGGIMPPKSTWFEPKLRDGVLSHDLRHPA